MRILGGIGAFLLGLLLVAAIVLGGWLAGWWFREQNVEKESHLFRNSYAAQVHFREDASHKIGEVQKLEVEISELGPGEREEAEKLEALATNISGQVCHDLSEINESNPELESFATTHCIGG